MPSLTLSALRSLEEEFYQIRTALEQQGVHIPPTARGAYRDLSWGQGNLRLYAVTWVVSEELDSPEWMLLIALSPQHQGQIPMHLKLEIKDETQLLFESEEDTNQGIPYAQVIGNWGERFWVTVTANHEAVFETPPFSFDV